MLKNFLKSLSKNLIFFKLHSYTSIRGNYEKNIHPDYHEINIEMTDGTKYITKSTWGKKGDTLKLDIDPASHPAWTGQHRIMDPGASC